MLKKLLIILTLCAVMQAASMDAPQPMDLDQKVVPALINNPSKLTEQCMNFIFAHKNNYTPQEIAALPVSVRNLLIGKMLIYLLGPVPAFEVEVRNEPFQPKPMQCVTTDGKFVFASIDGSLSIKNRHGQELAACSGHTGFIAAMLVTPKNLILSGSFDRTVRLWNTRGRVLAVCTGHQDCVNCVCVCGDLIVSGSSDNTVRIWNKRGKQLAQCDGHTAPVMQVRMQDDGNIVSASLDGTVRVWNIGLLADIQKMNGKQVERVWTLLQPYATKQDSIDSTILWHEVRQIMYPHEQQANDENAALPGNISEGERELKRQKTGE